MIEKKGGVPLKQLKLIEPSFKDVGLLEKILASVAKDVKLRHLALAGVHFDVRSIELLNGIVAQSSPMLIDLNLSWSKLHGRALKQLFQSLK